MSCPGNPIDWEENHLGLPTYVMDTATFLEYCQRQWETIEETTARLEALVQQHKDWHSKQTGYISACFINAIHANAIVAGTIQTTAATHTSP